jgi:uncharacterized protein YigE (DUF2233 family)
VAALGVAVMLLWAPRLVPRARVALFPEALGPLVHRHDDGGVRALVAEVSLERFAVRIDHRDGGVPFVGSGLVRMNAGIFEPHFVPTGLLVSGGVELHALSTASGTGNFYLQPNGVFAVTATGARVVETSQFSRLVGVTEATQSGPLLVQRGVVHPALSPGSKNVYVRNGVGVRDDGVVVFAVSREAVSLHDFATLFRDELACPDALYLDGFVSGLAVDGVALTDDKGPFGAVLVVEPR